MDLADPKIIAPAAALVGSLVGSFVTMRIFWWKRSAEIADRISDKIQKNADAARAEKIHDFDAFRPYADSLFAASNSLFYRLKEIIVDEGRAIYLASTAAQSDYNVYKRWSTIYRMATVLAWVRAFRREKSYLDIALKDPNQKIEDAINSLEAKLADGPHIEDHRTNELIAALIIKATKPTSPSERRTLSVRVENTLRSKLGLLGAKSANELDEDEQNSLIKMVANDISSFGVTHNPEHIQPQKKKEIIRILGIKEAWIFRDWQQAIGDFMIRRAPNGPRQYDVIGYGEFMFSAKKALDDPEDKDHCWIRNLYNLFNDLHPTEVDIFDARQNQIRATYSALELLMSAINAQKECYRSAAST